MQINERISITRNLVICTLCGPRTAGDLLANRSRVCRHASAEEVRRILALLEEKHRRRNAPARESICTIESGNQNGTYELSVLPDGTFGCTCLSFLGSRDLVSFQVRPGIEAAGCKHVRAKLPALKRAIRSRSFRKPKSPTDWQKLVLRALSIDPHPDLSDAQAYVAIQDLLQKQGVNYVEFEQRMRQDRKMTLLPINAFGVEFEGTGVTHEVLASSLTDAGLPTVAESYNHQTRTHFKIVMDSSLRGNAPFELVTPKLFAADGFKKIQTLCRTVRGQGGNSNASCGLHVHVDAWNCPIRIVKRLVALWYRLQPVTLQLVPPSRRTNNFSRPVTPAFVDQVGAMRSISSVRQTERYFNLNLTSYARHGTFEFRLHGGSFNARKVTSWIIYVLLVTAAARNGIDPTSIPQTWPGVAGALGLSTGTSVIRDAYRYLSERHRFFSASAPAAAASDEAA